MRLPTFRLSKLSPRLPRTWLGRAIVLVVLSVVAIGAWRKGPYVARKAMAVIARLRQVMPAAVVSTATGPLPADHAEYVNALHETTRFVLDTPPERWAPPAEKLAFKAEEPWKTSDDDIPQPSDEIKACRDRHPLLRPVPYPHYRALSIPSDCCGTQNPDLFYTHMLLSRKYGIDGTSSFFPFASYRNPADVFAIFNGESRSPRIKPVTIENETIDLFPYFLTLFHRGWVDHIHSWSIGSGRGYSVFEPCIVVVPASGAVEKNVEVRATDDTTWQAMALELAADEGIESFAIVIRDGQDATHRIVYGSDLDGQPGWVIDRIPADGNVALNADREANPRFDAPINESRYKGFPFKSIQVNVKGKSGAKLDLRSLRLFDITRDDVRRQIDWFARFNVLPNVCSYHGGNNCFVNCIERANAVTVPVETSDGRKETVKVFTGTAEGARPGAIGHCADLIADAGCVFGICSMGENVPLLRRIEQPDGSRMCMIPSGNYGALRETESRIKKASPHVEHFENLGALLFAALGEKASFGKGTTLYTHFNLYNGQVFSPDAKRIVYMNEVKALHPYAVTMLELLSNCVYDLDGKRRVGDRMWVVPAGVQAQFQHMFADLAKHAEVDGDRITIAPWIDSLTNKTTPDPKAPTHDLHGQTFYVKDSQKARVFVGDREITSLCRNPEDFTGRQSVTVVDVGCPTTILDEVDFYERNGRVVPHEASGYFTAREAYSGKYSLEVSLDSDGSGDVAWEPYSLTSNECGYLRFAYMKTNPASAVRVEFELTDGRRYIAAEGDLQGLQGWKLAPWTGDGFRDVVLDFAEMRMPAKGKKTIPRGEVRAIRFGIDGGKTGDSAFFDRVEFLSARANRPMARTGFLVGGKINPPIDGERITLVSASQKLEATTTRGGWYFFHDVDPESIAEIVYEKDGVRHHPIRGRLAQICKNDVEFHIHHEDPRSPDLPRPLSWVGKPIDPRLATRCTNSKEARDAYESYLAPHSARFYSGLVKGKWSYMVDDYTNNYGYIDRDRRFENKDNAIRVMIHGECWTEGGQTYTGQHLNMLVESNLRRATGVPVEVMTTATSSSSPASYALNFEKYGNRFRPDLTLVFLNPFNVMHMEPTLLEKLIGWKKDHAPYQMFDFGPDGKLVSYPPDDTYGAFMVPADTKPLVGKVSFGNTFFVNEATHPLVTRSFRLLKAIVKERFVDQMTSYKGEFGIIYGYDNVIPAYGTKEGSHTLATDRWNTSVREACEDLGVHAFDLSERMRRSHHADLLLWEHDGHLTPTGHVRIADALTEAILGTKSFQDRVALRRKQLDATMASRKRE